MYTCRICHSAVLTRAMTQDVHGYGAVSEWGFVVLHPRVYTSDLGWERRAQDVVISLVIFAVMRDARLIDLLQR